MAGKWRAMPPSSKRGKIAIDSNWFIPYFKNIENSSVNETKGKEINAACFSMFSTALHVMLFKYLLIKYFNLLCDIK